MCGREDGDACRRRVNGVCQDIMSGNTIVSRHGYSPSWGARRRRSGPPAPTEGPLLSLCAGYAEEYLNVEGDRRP